MNLIKNNITVAVVILSVLLLILFRSLGPNHFKSDAKKWAEPSFSKSNIIPVGLIDSIPGTITIINLDKEGINPAWLKYQVFDIPKDSVLNKSNLKTIRNMEGPVLLFVSDASFAARLWMVLSQMGLKDIYILSKDPGNENPRYHP